LAEALPALYVCVVAMPHDLGVLLSTVLAAERGFALADTFGEAWSQHAYPADG
jgi:hypothetical protein